MLRDGHDREAIHRDRPEPPASGSTARPFQRDINVVFPVDRVRELVGQHEIGSLASTYYSFMGAQRPPYDALPYDSGQGDGRNRQRQPRILRGVPCATRRWPRRNILVGWHSCSRIRCRAWTINGS